MSHTPGPWEVFEPDDWEFPGIESAANGQTTVVLWGFRGDDGGVRGDNPEQIASNARLIAAAPDLLEALEKCVESLRDNLSMCQYKNERSMLAAFESAELAIKKAKGGAE